MTIICAMHEPGVGTWIGSDTQAVRGGVIQYNPSKWARHGNIAIGSAGSHLLHNVIEREIAKPEFSAFTPFEMVQHIRRELIAVGYVPKVTEGECPIIQAWFIIATPTNVYHAATDGAVLEARGFCADGCGDLLAYGAAHVSSNYGFPPNKIIHDAVDAAISIDPNCGGHVFTDLLKCED